MRRPVPAHVHMLIIERSFTILIIHKTKSVCSVLLSTICGPQKIQDKLKQMLDHAKSMAPRLEHFLEMAVCQMK